MSNIAPQRPHARHASRFVSPEKKKRIQYDADKRLEESGRTRVYLHEKPPAVKFWPATEFMAQLILGFYGAANRLPTVILVPFQTTAPTMAYPVQGLPPDPDWDLSNGRGRLVEMAVIYSPDLPEVQVA